MQNRIYIVPRNGIKLLLPDGSGFLPPEGAFVEKTSFWIRRLRENDVYEKKAAVENQIIETKIEEK